MTFKMPLLKQFIHAHPSDFARALNDLLPAEALNVLKELDKSELNSLIHDIHPKMLRSLLAELSDEMVLALLEDMELDHALILCRQIRKKRRTILFKTMDETVAKKLEMILSHQEELAISLIDLSFLTLRSSHTLKYIFEELLPSSPQISHFLYVLDEEGKLLGVVSYKNLFKHLKDLNLNVRNIMETSLETIDSDLRLSELFQHKGWQNHHILPVVDEKHHFLGVIKLKTLFKIREELDKKIQTKDLQWIGKEMAELYFLSLNALLESTNGKK